MTKPAIIAGAPVRAVSEKTKMKSKKMFWLLVVAAGATLASISVILAQAGRPNAIYLDPKRPVEERIDDLMSRMTLKEKVGQLNLPCVYVE